MVTFGIHVNEAKDGELADVFDEALKKPKHIRIFMIESAEWRCDRFCKPYDDFQCLGRRFALIIDDLFLAPSTKGGAMEDKS